MKKFQGIDLYNCNSLLREEKNNPVFSTGMGGGALNYTLTGIEAFV